MPLAVGPITFLDPVTLVTRTVSNTFSDLEAGPRFRTDARPGWRAGGAGPAGQRVTLILDPDGHLYAHQIGAPYLIATVPRVDLAPSGGGTTAPPAAPGLGNIGEMLKNPVVLIALGLLLLSSMGGSRRRGGF